MIGTSSVLAFLTLVMALCEPVFAQDSPRACRSVHLMYSEADGSALPEASGFYNEVAVEKTTTGSYFMACGFSKGYFGIQELSNGKKVVLFSVWEPGKQNNPNATPEERRVKTVDSGKNVRVKRFGGEGTGGQSFYDFEWKIGQACRFVVYAKGDGERTQYAGYVYVPEEHRWQHMATFSTLADGHLLRQPYSFVEDFRRDGDSATIVHQADFGNGWIRVGDEWKPMTSAKFTADGSKANHIDSTLEKDRWVLTTGGDTKNDNTVLGTVSSLDKVDRKPPLDLPRSLDGRDEKDSDRIRILAYNIKHGQGNDKEIDLDRIATVIRRLNPDVVALQEVDNKVARSDKIDQPAVLGKLTGMHHAFSSFFDYQGGEYGMAVLSRRPIKLSNSLRLPDGLEPRTSLVVKIEGSKPGTEFILADVHFYATEEERLAQASKLLKESEKETLPVIIAGDFNSEPGSPVLKLFEGQWNIPDKGEDAMTFSSDDPRKEIDFIMFRPKDAFIVEEIDVIEEPVASDHRPVTLDLKFKK